MAIRIVRKGNTGSSNDHNLLFNRELNDQHPIESITGLRAELDSKYTMPAAGIPRKDMSFNVASMEDIEATKVELQEEVRVVDNKTIGIDQRTTAIEDFINNIYPTLSGDSNLQDRVELEFKPDIHEEFIAEEGDTDFILSVSYQPGNHSLKVFLNGSLQKLNDDYIEASETIVRFTFPLDSGDYVCLMSSGRTNINSPIHEEFEYMGDNIFNLAYRYNKGDNSLSVYHNGIRLNVNRDYKEIDDYTIEITKASISIGDVLVFRRETHMSAEVILNDTIYNASEPWKQSFVIINDTTTVLTLAKEYVPGASMLQIFVDGLLQDEGSEDDYIESGAKEITFNYPIERDSKVDVICKAGAFSWVETFVSVDEQKVFRLSYKYNINQGDIFVYENGLLLTPGDDYVEVNFNTIKFLETPDIGSKIKVYKRR